LNQARLDDDTDYPLLFRFWQPVDLPRLEQGLRAAQVPLKASKEALKGTDPRKWRGYLLGVWERRQKQHPELRERYDSKLTIAQDLLQEWVTAHPIISRSADDRRIGHGPTGLRSAA
jgi:hypothetical protein